MNTLLTSKSSTRESKVQSNFSIVHLCLQLILKKWLNTTLTQPKPGKWASTNSLTGLMNNLSPFHWVNCPRILNKSQLKKSTLDSEETLIGEMPVSLPQSKTKVVVDHAGLSLLLPLMNHIKFIKNINQKPSF